MFFGEPLQSTYHHQTIFFAKSLDQKNVSVSTKKYCKIVMCVFCVLIVAKWPAISIERGEFILFTLRLGSQLPFMPKAQARKRGTMHFIGSITFILFSGSGTEKEFSVLDQIRYFSDFCLRCSDIF